MNDNNEQDDLKQLRDLLVAFGIVFILVFFVGWIWLWAINVVPIRDSFSHDRFSILEPKEYFELRDKGIKSVIEGLKVLATIFGGIAILGNLFYAAKRAKALDASAIAANATAKAALDNARAALKNAEAAQDKQITERFTKAVEQLASQEIAIRLGGIYALERIANNSKDDHWTIMEVLTAFVREKSPLKEEEEREQLPKIPTDIQAALTVIGRRDLEQDIENEILNLRNTNLRGATFRYAKLQRIDFSGADLERANFQGANLEWVVCNKAQPTIFGRRTDQIEGKTYHGVDFREANLRNAFLMDANLRGANFQGANLEGANLNIADLEKVQFYGANLRGTYLGGAKKLTQQQIESASGDSTTVLPNNLTKPEKWRQSE